MDDIILAITERYEELRRERDLTLKEVGEQADLSKSALGSYELNSEKGISSHAIVSLAKFYGVTSDYLLGLSDMRNHPNADLNDLHLSDEMIDILKSGRLNNRLLCEMVTHEGFLRFLVDTEIYIDRIADMHINDANEMLNAHRKLVMERAGLDDNELNMRALKLSQIDTDDYFAHTIFEDLRPIIRDIREAHKGDITTADIPSPAEVTTRLVEDALNYEGTPEEQQVMVFLSMLGIDYNELTKEEFVTLIGIINKSTPVKMHRSRRGMSQPSHRKKRKK